MTKTMFKKILVVEDDRKTLSSLYTLLMQHGYEVQTLTEAEYIFQEVTAFNPHLILLGALSHGSNGAMICAALKSAPLTSKIPVISVLGSKQSLVKLYENADCSPDDFIMKPINAQVLLNKIEYRFIAN
ncbi:response regulator [Mucilaginibacter sp. HME9299]|uniref:Response regulator n=2 Tax=Mucilaginibacter aquatilis TaxID=1517760 RepID=A0A6I4IAF7_9SPHI|nr:response regulator [Mucilaginibacter aquatilis]